MQPDSLLRSVPLVSAPLALTEGETTLSEFEPNLDPQLCFGNAKVVLTQRRILYSEAEAAWQQIELGPDVSLQRQEHLGLGELQVQRAGLVVASFRFTLAQAAAAGKFLETWQSLVDGTLVLSEPVAEEEVVSAKTSGFALLRLLAFALPETKLVVAGALLTFAATGVGLIPPYLTMPLVDEVLAPPGGALPLSVAVPRVGVYLAGLAGAAVFTWILSWAQGSILARVSERVAADLRVRAFAHLQRLGLRYFGGKRTGDLIARISSDTEHLCSFLSDTLIDFVTDVLMIAGTAIVLVSLDPMLAFAALGSFPLIAVLIVKIRSRLASGFLRGGRVWSAMTSILADTIPGIRVVKAFSQEQREIERFRVANQQIVDVNNRVNALWTFFWPLVAFLNQIGLLVVWAVGAWQVLHNHITVGVLTAFVAYISRFYVRVESMSRMLTATQRASAAAQRLFEILDREPEVMEPKDPIALPQLRGELRFENVSFRYGTRMVLNSVSFTVAPGQLVGIVGHTGSGKSTVANLICRFYDPAAGSLLVDGVDIRRVPLQQYREHIGIVLQDPFLFFGTIAENVSYGNPSAPREQILAAARAARAHDFVLRLPEGYDSLVGERGQSLSGGERQRLAIARAIFVNPEILILDEATSAVDVQTEREIQRALDNVVKGRTTVAIAHRLSTLEKADLLVVLKHGHVVEIGRPAELMRKNGEFAAMARAQLGAEEAGVAVEAASGIAAKKEEQTSEPELPAPWSGAELQLSFEASGELWAQQAGVRRRASPRRCFPLSNPDAFICLVDELQREFACIEALSELSDASRAALLTALAAFEFLPAIESIGAIELIAARTHWQVTTDRGPCSFYVEQEDHVRPLPDGRYIVTDSHGMRYLLKRAAALDTVSRRLLAKVA